MITRIEFDKFLLTLSQTTLGFRRKIVLLKRALKRIENKKDLSE